MICPRKITLLKGNNLFPAAYPEVYILVRTQTIRSNAPPLPRKYQVCSTSC